MLTDAIRFYLEANPAMHDELIDFVRNAGTATPLPENTEVFTDAIEWYEAIRDVGRGRHVSASDIPDLRAFGYAIYDPDNKRTLHLYVNLSAFKRDFPTQVQRLFKTAKQRQEFALLVSQGKAPDLQG